MSKLYPAGDMYERAPRPAVPRATVPRPTVQRRVAARASPWLRANASRRRSPTPLDDAAGERLAVAVPQQRNAARLELVGDGDNSLLFAPPSRVAGRGTIKVTHDAHARRRGKMLGNRGSGIAPGDDALERLVQIDHYLGRDTR
ncbi:MAG: hypothetical protein H7123_09260, partial [Thermoleophilia bacterium]|nr:hypothetical protein [Thermoleophilia bacterium]